MRHTHLRIRWLMAAVAVVAVLLSLPPLGLLLSSALVVVVGLLILLPAAAAPRGHRVEVAYWATALHPLMFLAWLGTWRFLLDTRPLGPTDDSWYLTLTLGVPYFLAWFSHYYLWVLFAVGAIVGAARFPEGVFVRPLLTLVGVWLTTWIVLTLDPSGVGNWFWD
jgi:hypothetical protein